MIIEVYFFFSDFVQSWKFFNLSQEDSVFSILGSSLSQSRYVFN